MVFSCEEVSKRIAAVRAAIERSRGPNNTLIGNEYCNGCGSEMDFPIMTHIDDPIRFEDGACYREGAGQTCAECEARITP
jgi:hypothetical protein